MIFDFPIFLNSVLPTVQIIMQLVLGITSTIALLEWRYGYRIIKFGHLLKPSTIAWLLIINILTQLVVFPCADIGANCWENCFGFTVIGQVGYLSSYAVLALIGAMVFIFHFRKISKAWAVPVLYLYGIFAFLQIGYLDKGLWCIVRSSGYEYLWSSFEIVIFVQWFVYFSTLSLFYLDLMTRHEDGEES